MEKNAWRVAEEVARRIDDEPGPAGDFMKSYTTSEKKRQFFFNRPYLMKYASTQSEKKDQTINSSDRLVGNTDQSSLKCDRYNLIPGWYRFTGDAGDKIPNTRPPHTRRCGTHAPGWIRGSNPVVADGEVTRTVCYFWSGNDCRRRNSIKVKNCGAFYVYELQKPPACSLRYCGE